MSATGSRWSRVPSSFRHGAEAGATLLEMLVVVGVMALVATLGLASFRPALRRASLAAQGGGLVLSLYRTRAVALRTDKAAMLVVAPDGRSYVAAGRTVVLAPGVQLTSEPQVVAFSPDGTSGGARLRLGAGHRRLDFTVSTDGLLSRAPG